MHRTIFISTFVFILNFPLLGQQDNYSAYFNIEEYTKEIEISNGSFEKMRYKKKIGLIPFKWQHCGFLGHGKPTIQFGDKPELQSSTKPYNGDKFYNLVVRADTTYEALSHKLAKPLKAHQKYYISFQASIDKHKETRVRIDRRDCCTELKKFNTPVSIRLIGGNEFCEFIEELSITQPIRNVNWQEIVLEFKPTQELGSITIEASYDQRANRPYYGNVNIDAVSDIYVKKNIKADNSN